MKKYLLFLLAPLLYSAANASTITTRNEVKREHVTYSLTTITEKSDWWVNARTRGVNSGGESKITRYAYVMSCDKDYYGHIVIKDTLMDDEGGVFPVIGINSHAFENANFVLSVSMPDRIDEIGTCTFKGCTGLSSVTVQESQSKARQRVSTNEDYGENSNGARKKVLFSTEKIDDSAFEDCTSLTFVRLPSAIKKIGNRVFANCKSLKSVSFSSDVQNASVLVPSSAPSSFGTEVFADCKEIDMVYADKWVHSINENTFDDKVYAREHLSCPEDAEEKLKGLDGWKRFFFSGAPSSKSKTVNVSAAGTLSSYISETEKYNIEELTIIGPLNGTDFRLIRDMAGCNHLGEITNGKLKILDLSGASIVAGGEMYLDADWVHFSTNESASGGHLSIKTDNEIADRLFMSCQFEQIVLPNNITGIGESSFYHCINLTSISFPDGVVTIGESAFHSCYSLVKASLPPKLTALGGYAFAFDQNLVLVNIPDGITVIEDATFLGCASLSAIKLPDGLKTIKSQPFERCSSLKTVTIPRQVTSIGSGAFAGCDSLISIIVDADNSDFVSVDGVLYNKSITRIIQYPGGKADSEYSFPEGVSSINGGAFQGCKYLSKVSLPKSLTALSGGTFMECTNLVELTIPKNIRYFWYGEFSGCSNLQTIVSEIPDPTILSYYPYDNFPLFSDYTYSNAILYVPYGTKALYKQARDWKGFANIIEQEQVSPIISFADSEVKRICVANWDTNRDGELSEAEAAAVSNLNGKFYQNEDIETFDELSYFTGLKEIGSYEFDGCTNLKSLKLPDNVTKIGYAAFANCYSLSSIEMPQTIESIGAFAFQDCKSITKIDLPSAITKISKATFIRCTSLQNIAIPDNVAIIDSIAFDNCSQLLSIQCSTKLDCINQGAFAACSNLSSISLPASLTYIGEQVFAACTSLRALNIPAKVQTIGLGIVGNCTSLTSLTVNSSNPYFYAKGNGIVDKRINMLVQSCKTTEIPKEVVGIADYGFIFVSGRDEIVIPENVMSIGYDAFQNCNDLKRLTIPKAIEFIGKEAFLNCESLEKVTVLNPEPVSISKNVFEIHDKNNNPIGFTNATLYVPSGSKAKYQVADGWNSFTNIIEMEQKTLTLMVNRCEREYGEDNPTFTYTAEGGSFTGKPEITCEATKTSPAGIYPITISKGSIDFDGKITFINANLSVTRATLTITADDKTITEGDDMPELTVTYTGFKNNETEDVLIRKPTLRTTGSSSNGPGTYPIYVSGAYAENYLFKYVDGRLTILKKEVVEVWNHTLVLNFNNGTQKKFMLKDMSDVQFSGSNLIVKTKGTSDTYRRSDILELKFIDALKDNEHVIFTANNYTRLYGEDNPSFAFKSEGANYTGMPTLICEATNTSPVGTYPILINQGSVDNDNTTFLPGTLTVTKAPLTVTADNKTIIQGDEIPELTFSYAGFANGETEEVLIREPVASTTATSDSKPGEYPITIRDGAAQNYEFYYKDGILTIRASAPAVHMLILHLNDGSRERFILSEQPRFMLSDEKLIVKTSNMGAVYLRSDIREFTFEEITNDIHKDLNPYEIIIKQLPNGNLAIDGLEIGAIVRVYDLRGYIVYTSSPSIGDKLLIPLETRKSGVYIININNKRTIKIHKK